ncbi:MAG: hypothetical protein MUP70_05065, partial [Candidatus Aminicenantes bacterium]|nr:hypothetical protein [Candidatus Aminicenantes bacterium]
MGRISDQTSMKEQSILDHIRRFTGGLFVLFLFFFIPVSSFSHETAVGLILVGPTGLSAKIWNNQSGWAGAIGWIPGNEESVRIQVDYLLNHVDLLDWDRTDLRF